LRKSFEVADQKVVSYIKPDVVADLISLTKKSLKGKKDKSKKKDAKEADKLDLLLELWDNLCKGTIIN